ncbi:YjgP/YjgQ family permease [bacterium]|jgi:lipopolysaccharide export system permease protein|nr:YjgP/YjgQ family permease [bacterium]MBT3581237.1 YjgP/YjgQ family permease [bacterium]MBT4552348.1 YjgP/YjgQ family permease [bacterium]MBT5988980.1 YjgP/YjgQ family permease [bacterium]MBT7087870.1 YjgP/YjgQ family permease [bacterium]
MKIIDKYLFKELIGPFVFGIAAFTSILSGSAILLSLVSTAVKYSFPLYQTIQLFIYKIPEILVFTFPMSMLLSSILTFSRLNSDMEIIAFKASGISIYRLLIPIIAMGLAVSFLTIWFNESIVPKANYSSETLFYKLTQEKQTKVKKNINLTEYDQESIPIRIINIRQINQNSLQDITIAEFEFGRLARLIRAQKGQWLGHGNWEFNNGVMHYFPKKKDIVVFTRFAKELLNIKVDPVDLTKREKTTKEMNTRELKKRIEFKAKMGADTTSDLVNLHMKYAIPFASLIFSVLGAVVGLKPQRSSSALGLGISLFIIVIYYILISISLGLGLAGFLHPFIAAWLPNIIIGTMGLVSLNKLGTC